MYVYIDDPNKLIRTTDCSKVAPPCRNKIQWKDYLFVCIQFGLAFHSE